MVVNRFKDVLDRCIDSDQSTFVSKRLISDNILLTYEILHAFHHKIVGKKGFVVVKLDTSKAYDRVEMGFLREMILRMGFDLGEGLSALMRLVVRESLMKRAKASRSGLQISQLLFAYDCVLFGEANVNGAQTLRTILREHESCSGQCVNYDKSIVLYRSNTLEGDRRTVFGILRVRYSNDLERY
ncbi:uncharacterized protein [Gossypium hirsutum]|uniref:Reverse transcriptase n=1 Tax=Gossypium hirsutum TaxID=3635 RepID=A0ABM3AM33_GOSHI|nr:uncharacterized protein LOC121220299 [Gossypium hirsutum]